MNRQLQYLVTTVNWACKNARKLFIILIFSISAGEGFSQKEGVYDEVSINLNVQRIGNTEIQAIIYNQAAYLPVKELFDFLKIKNSVSDNLDSISGFIISPQSSFSVSYFENSIVFKSKLFDLKVGSLIKTEHSLYLKSDFFGQVFGLDCTFDFRSLSVALISRIELPALLELQQQQMRKNIGQLRGERKADTTLKREFPLFSLGMADWSVNSMQEASGLSNTIINLGIGANIAGGEATAYLNYNSNAPFKHNQQLYRWRYVNNDKKSLRQVTLGNVFVQTISTIDANVAGIQFTNSPSTYKRSFGSYTISNKTEPEWTVELYINNVLVNYTKADASGFFSFEVPSVYGRSIVKMRHISPWGEERIVEEIINIPYNFLPANEFEYMVTAGLVSDEAKSRFTRMNFNYGLNNRITIGAGVEYLSSVKEDRLPFVNASMRVGSNIIVSGEHTYQVRSKGILTYKLPSNLQLDVSYIKYDPYQTAIRTAFLDEKKAVLSLPLRLKKFSSFYRFSFSEATLPKSKLSNVEVLASAMFKGINTNLTTFGVFTSTNQPYLFSNFSIAFRLPAGIRISPQIQYEYRQKQFSMVKFEAEKRLFKNGSVNLGYENFFASKNQIIGLGLRYNFGGAQTMVSVRKSNYSTLTTQNARGSLMYNTKSNKLTTGNLNNVGRGGLSLKAFLDLNDNGKKDNNEPAVAGLKFKISGGKIHRNIKDTSVSVSGLESYANYFVELNKNSFDNIAWQIKKSTFNVTIEPNRFKEVDVAVTVFGEVSGMVYLGNNSKINGLGRMIVNIFDINNVLVAKTLTESDGYFYYMGLMPGTYSALIDEVQLTKLKMKSSEKVYFNIKTSKDGDVVDGLKFVLKDGANK